MNLYFRFFANVLKNLFFPVKADIFDETALEMRVLPNDLDVNMHMNNGRFLSLMDIGRGDFTMKMDLHKTMLKEKWVAFATAINVVYLKPLKVFDKFILKTKLLAWDDEWFYMEQRFEKDGFIMASAVVKAAFLKRNKRISPHSVIETASKTKQQAPGFPDYLRQLVEGEEAFITKLRDANRSAKKL